MYTIKQAALRAGVSVPLLRAWERRYGIVSPERTRSGYRLYDDSAIARVRAMRLLIETGWSASQAAEEVLSKGVPPVDRPAGRPSIAVGPEDAGEPRSASERTDAFVDAAEALDEARLDTILDGMFALGTFELVVHEHVFPALRALGDAWAAGIVSVAAEHAASHAVLRRLAAAFEAAGRGVPSRPVLVGLPPGSRHELGAIAFATAIRRRGLPVVYLGADVPVDAWNAAVKQTDAQAVVLAVPTARDRKQARQVMQTAQELNPDLLLAAGGAGAPGADLPASVLLLSDGIPNEAAVFERSFSGRSSRRGRATSPSDQATPAQPSDRHGAPRPAEQS
jgi:DNA-binding transcriptional MerR regulator/methylmalonyl-CoA mutase cobalamin-binding subunit